MTLLRHILNWGFGVLGFWGFRVDKVCHHSGPIYGNLFALTLPVTLLRRKSSPVNRDSSRTMFPGIYHCCCQNQDN